MRRLLRRPEVLALTGLSTTSLYRRIREGTFPRPVRIGPNAVAWDSEAVEKWLEAAREGVLPW